jgi:hypothetical protein
VGVADEPFHQGLVLWRQPVIGGEVEEQLVELVMTEEAVERLVELLQSHPSR